MCASPTTSTAIFCSLRICHIPSHLLSGWCTFRFPWPPLCPFRGRSALGCVGGRVDWFLIGVSPLCGPLVLGWCFALRPMRVLRVSTSNSAPWSTHCVLSFPFFLGG
ncbi:unnamed protein product [Mycena citricolor]|uniref:Uncharacterized protein n=1 Tax=Mycena citricolor TaxID=2018698 RepID=A0AAD2HWF0_9AGAR|nr:unnamed protein product [Mycena citricolor]